jgi:hypothetical protein
LKVAIPDFAGERAKTAGSALSSTGLSADRIFIKYGQPEHMRKLDADQSYTPMAIGSMRKRSRSLHGNLTLD